MAKQSAPKPSGSYYRNCAIVRKIKREGTGLVAERMTDKQLYERLSRVIGEIERELDVYEHSNVVLARAAWELTAVGNELLMRGHQLKLF